MTNNTIKEMLVNEYTKLAFTDKYIYGFVYKKVVYAVFEDDSTLDYLSVLGKTSSKRGGGYSLRFRPVKAQKEFLLKNKTCFALCSKDYFDEVIADSKYNKGSIFEMLVTNYFGQEWKADSVPFTVAGDLEIDGVPYQIKFQEATFTTEKTLMNLKKRGLTK